MQQNRIVYRLVRYKQGVTHTMSVVPVQRSLGGCRSCFDWGSITSNDSLLGCHLSFLKSVHRVDQLASVWPCVLSEREGDQVPVW